ncbi:hypothetical protein SEA_STEAMY_87 [Mycobacterium phage Steamy]|uniref:Uncharacterized protein n=1 Tax=Mycobacterium phage Steamy TaxID=2250309 RepID=A0A345L0Q9_9CAUD|nr:hypothetical protein KIV62_gp14 [Mycobacterium phage Steamy]AXH48861.1 hypothetical protein SEA_STEAMY_87 [Mycobacterium phage Steamy]
MTAPTTYFEATALIIEAKARGARVMCGMQCGSEATLLLACPDGTLQGVGCGPCWESHRNMIEAAKIAEASGMAEPFCSRCGEESPSADHIITEGI